MRNVAITGPRRCKNALCSRFATFGSRYCDRHGPGGGLGTNTDTDLTTLPDRQGVSFDNPGPSRRDLQRQLDRLEGKLDALLALLKDDD